MKLIKDLFTNLKQSKVGDGIDQASMGAAQLSAESLDASTAQKATSDIASIQKDVGMAISAIVASTEGLNVSLSDAQTKAAKLISKVAVCSKEDMLKLMAPTRRVDDGAALTTSDAFGGDVIADVKLAQEAFDGMQPTNALYYSVGYNLLAARQDEFGEAFFPTIVIDPTQSGIVVENVFATLVNEITRDAKSDRNKFNKRALIKNMYNGDALTSDRNKCVPVYDASHDAYMLKDFKYVTKESGEDVETAPLAVGKEIGLLGLSQTASMLAKGTMDNTDALDRTIQLKRVYFSVDTEKFFFDASMYPYSNFTAASQGHFKEMTLNFKSESVVIDVAKIKQADGSPATVFTGVANCKLRLGVALTGNANLEGGNIEVFGNKIELLEVINPSGDVVAASDSLYTTAAQQFAKAAILGYTVDAWRTNSNLRTRGQLITVDKQKQEYQVPLRSGVSMLAPVVTDHGIDNDIEYLNAMVQATQIRTSRDAVRTLTMYSDILENVVHNEISENIEVAGIGRYSVNPYFSKQVLDLSKVVDSLSSSARLEDIKAGLLNKIINAVITADIKSNYGAAHRVLNNNLDVKKKVVIGTDPQIKFFLTGNESKLALSSNIDAEVVCTYDPKVAGKIFVTFVVDNDKDVKPNPLNFGNMVWAPTITTDVSRTVSGSHRRELMTIPRYAHIVNLPILVTFDVSDPEGVLSKVVLHNKVIP